MSLGLKKLRTGNDQGVGVLIFKGLRDGGTIFLRNDDPDGMSSHERITRRA